MGNHYDRTGRGGDRRSTPPTASDLADGQVLLRTLAGGLCGSDGPFYRRGFGKVPAGPRGHADEPAPLHEVVGEVLASRSEHHSVGDRVVGWAESFAALREVTVARGASLYRYDPELSPELAVTLQPLACVRYAVECIGDVTNRDCAVIGQGSIGILFSHVLKSAGAKRVTGIDPVDRTDVAKAFCVDQVVTETSSEWARGCAEGVHERPDILVEAVGHQVSTLRHALDAIRPMGTIFYFGIPDDEVYPVNMEQMMRKNLTLMSGITPLDERRRALAAADKYLRDHPDLPQQFVTHQFGLDRVADAYQLAFSPRVGRLKVVVTTAAAS